MTPLWLVPFVLAGQSFRGQTLAGSRAQGGTDSLAARVDSIFAPFTRRDAPGCEVAVVHAGTLLYQTAYGMADVALEVPLTPATPTLIASASKQFTALGILLLVQDGRLALDDDVRRYVSEVPRFGHPITVRQLLTHTSGLREQWNLFYMAGWRSSDLETKDDFLRLVQRQRALNFTSGTEFLYSNTGYTLLAIIIERVSGMSFRQFLQMWIFTPLEMSHSGVREDPGQPVAHLAAGYWGHAPSDLRLARVPFGFAGPTGVFTTVEDLAKWDANFYEARVGSIPLLALMSTPGRLTDGTATGYGMGLFVGTYQKRRMISHAGSDPGYKADIVRFPDERLTVAVLCNAFDVAPTPLALRVADIYLGALPATSDSAGEGRRGAVMSSRPQAVSASAIPATSLAGIYWWNRSTAQTRRFFLEDGVLLLDGGGEGKFKLTPLGNNRYQLGAAPRRYVFAFQRRAAYRLSVVEEVEGSRPLSYEAVRATRMTAERELVGSYYSTELEVRWDVELRNGRLELDRHRMDPAILTRVFGDVFQAENFFVIEFVRDAAGSPVAVDVTTERARHVRFERVNEIGSTHTESRRTLRRHSPPEP
ncbi:MAG: serine hydrolase domain-containing protein [Gemmatimonadaceae bacterium]